ncbi:MAG: metal-dependent transcriptional regulator [Clostridia bacterium]|nr:metal-dependent transcriptional regulator [Clostridia bacterium]
MRIHQSAEDYLEMILMLTEKNGAVRSVDIAAGLQVSKPSVSVAMKNLRENGYIRMDKENYITLTEQGMEVASKVYRRHKILTRFLMQLGVEEEIAREDACKIEHQLSPQTFEAILRHMEQ